MDNLRRQGTRVPLTGPRDFGKLGDLARPVGLAILLALGGCGGSAATLAVVPAVSDANPGGSKRCLILTTNDSEANFDGPRLADGHYQGTISRVAAYKREKLKEKAGAVLLLEGGDVLQGRFMARADGDRARAMREAWQVYDQAGYDFGALGNHEFDAGPKPLRVALQGLSRYRLLSANLLAQGTALEPQELGRPQGLFGATALVDCGGIRVGLFGLLTPSARTISQMGDVKMPAEPINGPARQAVDQLRSQGAQVVIALSHLGVGEDVALARDVTGIDVVVGGHSHTPLRQEKRQGSTLITQTGARFANLGELEMVLDGDGDGLDLRQSAWRLRPIDASLPQDPQIEAQIAGLRQGLVPEVVVGQRKLAWDLTNPRGEYSQLATRALVAAANEAAKSWPGPQLPVVAGLLNAGGFRSHTEYPPGPVTNLDVAAIHPFANRAVVVEMTGQQLLDTLEHGCAPGSDGHGQGIVNYGLQGSCDRSKPTPKYQLQDGKPVALLERGQRLQGALLGGQPIEPKARYRVATIDYLARGGSGFWSLSQGDRRCFDGQPYTGQPDAGEGSCRSPLMAEVIEAAVRAGTLER